MSRVAVFLCGVFVGMLLHRRRAPLVERNDLVRDVSGNYQTKVD